MRAILLPLLLLITFVPFVSHGAIVQSFNDVDTTKTDLDSSDYKKFRFTLAEETSFKSFIIALWLPGAPESCFSIWNQNWTTLYYSSASGDDDYGDANPGEYSHCNFTGTAENGATLVSGVLTLPAGNYVIQTYQNPGGVSGKGYSSNIDSRSSFGYGGNASSDFTSYGDLPEIQYAFCDTDVCSFGYDSDVTRIDTVTPADEALLSTTTTSHTFGSTGFVAEGDYVSGMYVSLFLKPNVSAGFSALYGVNGALLSRSDYQDLQFPVTSFGSYTFSTTTDLNVDLKGGYYLVTSVRKPLFSLLGFNIGSQAVVSTTTRFAFGEFNAWDVAVDESISVIEEFGSATSTSSFRDACVTLDTDTIQNCLTFLFVPNAGYVSSLLERFRDELLSKFPWGYLTRFSEIMLSDDVVSVPPISYTFGTNAPDVLEGETISFQVFDHFDYVDTIVSDTDGENIWEIIDPYITTILYIGFFLYVMSRLLNTDFRPRFDSSDSISYTDTVFEDDVSGKTYKTNQIVTKNKDGTFVYKRRRKLDI